MSRVATTEAELAAELTGLKVVLARRLRECLEGKDPVAPALLDVARRFLDDNTPKGRPTIHAPPLVLDTPFPDEVE